MTKDNSKPRITKRVKAEKFTLFISECVGFEELHLDGWDELGVYFHNDEIEVRVSHGNAISTRKSPVAEWERMF